MCRIYGHFNSAVPPAHLDMVADRQRHGGPDAHGRAAGAEWSVGANRLAIMDLAGGRQPYQLAGGAVQVAFNGEIYNHRELRESLRHRGYHFADHCDGSILPALYDVYGDDFPDHLDGMYAVAVLDLRGKPRLVLATDHVGMKPLFYSWHPGQGELFFASEIPALLAFEAVPRTLWTPGLDAYLATKTPFGEQTMFAGIRTLPPSTTAVCDHNGLCLIHRTSPTTEVDPTETVVRDRLRDEVHRLLAADVPVATITSGGLDSSLVTVLAAEVAADLHTFNIAYTGSWPDDERHFAREVAAHAGVTYHQVEIDPATFPDLLPEVVRHLGQPNADPITLSSHALFARIHDAGFKVALTGDGADEVFGGYGRMRAATEAAAAGQPWQSSYVDELAVLPTDMRRKLYTADYAVELDSDEPALPAAATTVLDRGKGTVLDRITEFELAHRLPAYHLRRVDHMSMASSVEARLPYCQREIVALGRRLPDRLRIEGGKVKRALNAAAAGSLPPSVLARKKQPFTLPIAAMFAPGWPLWDYAHDLLAPDRLRRAGQVDPQAVQALFDVQAVGPDARASLALWALLVHEVWREQFIDNPEGT
ncbi:asparagine synthase (glutamine-hydrolyzing) [Actinocrispum wychmicini]|uniref:asparagine synthase (glutamine-hydrolyzing) n=1 Tax=Actinocrispum wychmicini TaxID=1213861 RepID=A0A4R2J9Q0_9PSEU|nr:asparagine synthase (glutamine-hydrolyzing) [Actinocrispum wychmicini]TCO56073.1 asparagine synthase (glutamine-hydrolysing) [Actinocrispum wychmicini]